MVVMGKTGMHRNWVWNVAHPTYGPALVNGVTEVVISFELRPHKRGRVKLYEVEGSEEVEEEIDFGVNTYQDWVGAACWVAARYGTGELDDLTVAVGQLHRSWAQENT